MIKMPKVTRFKLIAWTIVALILTAASWLFVKAVLAGDYWRLALAIVPAAFFAIRMRGRAKDA